MGTFNRRFIMKKRIIMLLAAAALACLAGSGAGLVGSAFGTSYLEIVPVEDFNSSGLPGGPFVPDYKQYQLTNTSLNSLWWGVDKSADWLDVTPDWGPLLPSGSETITVSLTSDANLLTEGIYADTLTFFDITNNEFETRGVTLSIISLGLLDVSPTDGFASGGRLGGPFLPLSKDYQLTNSGSSPLDWRIDKTVDWLDLTATEGTLYPLESVITTVSLNAAAESLPEGSYTDTLVFDDLTNDQQQTRPVTLSVSSGIWFTPVNFDVNQPEGCTLTKTLTIGNETPEDFDFVLKTRQTGSSQASSGNMLLAAAKAGHRQVPLERDFTVAADATFRPGRLLVRFAAKKDKTLPSTADKQQILTALGAGDVERDFIIVPGLSVVQLPPEMPVEEALKVFNKADGVLYAEPDYEIQALSTFPDDPSFDQLWGMHNTGQTGGTADADIDAPEAWDIATGSREIVVAVIDTGVDYMHQDLAANMWVNEAELNGTPGVDDDGNGYVDDIYGYDFYNNDGNPMDDHFHGTHCAGTIGAVGDNATGVAGVCWKVRIMAVKFLSSFGSGWTEDAIASVQYSTLMGANLSSNSWGGGGYSQALKDAIDAAGAAGMLFVAAAGNSSANTDVNPHYPSSYTSDSLISVMATDKYDNRSSFSNYGPVSVDLGAPGSDILSCQPGNRYQYLDGTSMATPHVAGACALLWSMNPAMGNQEVKDILLSTVDETLPGLCVSGGRLNLHKAILETNAPWIELQPESGTVSPAGSNDINVTFNAVGLEPGLYQAEIMIISSDPCSPRLVPVTMVVTPDDLSVSPVEGFEASGSEGGPFEPQCMVYTLTNIGDQTVNWTTLEVESWLDISPYQGTLGPGQAVDVNVCISSDADLLDPNLYTEMLTFKNTDSNSIKPRAVVLVVKPPDCFTESFGDSGSDLSGYMLTFSPDGSVACYEACREMVDIFPTDPNGGTFAPLWDDDYVEVVLSDNKYIWFYETTYDRFYIGSNGYITFGGGDTEYDASLENHFNMPRISALFCDLAPLHNHCISYRQFEDRVAVTFQGLPVYGDKTATNSFQIEMFFADGTISITWLDVAKAPAVAGLSRGRGLPPVFFEQSDLNRYAPCRPFCDLDKDYTVNFADMMVFAEHWLDLDCAIPYWCTQTDIDRSTAVDFGDFAWCAANWLVREEWWLGPVSHWKFDEGQGEIAYDSAGNNDGTIYGAAWTTGKIGDYALEFDGGNDYVGADIGTTSGPVTYAFWFNTDQLSVTKRIVTRDWTNGGSFGTLQQGGEVKAVFGLANGTQGPTLIGGAISTDVWYHAACVFDGSSVALYVNGSLKDIQSQASILTDSNILRIGADPYYYFDGAIDDVRLYDRALSAEEIRRLYQEGGGPKASNPDPSDGAYDVDPNAVLTWWPGKGALSHDVYLGSAFDDVNDANTGSTEYMGNYDVNSFDPCGLDLETTYYWRVDEVGDFNTYKGNVWSFTTMYPVEPNLLSWWKFDEGQGGIAYDSAGDNDGTIYGAAWTAGKIGDYALAFDGLNDYVGADVGTTSGPVTYAFWFKTDQLSVTKRIVTRNWTNGGSFGTLHQGGEVKAIFRLGNGTQGATLIGGAISTNVWYHAACVFDGSNVVLYVDGSLKDMQSQASILTDSNIIRIGAEIYGGTNFYFDGVIDEIRLYNRALTEGEIQQLYQQGL